MKKLIICLAVMMGIVFSGCQKKLDIPNPNAATIENFWLNGNDAVLGVNAVYSVLHRGAISRYMPMFLLARADEGHSTSPFFDLQNALDKFVITNYNYFFTADVYQDNYQGINRANQVITYVPNITMEDPLKQRIIGEAKFLRGLYYFHLATLYGNVPMMLEPSKTGALPSTATQTEVYAQIVKDLNEAAAVLPTTYPSAELGRATKGAAYALLAKVYMQQKMWTEALTPLQWLVEGDGRNVYILMPNYRDNFLVTTENNRESIFEWQFETNTTETHDDDLQDPNQNYGTSLAQFIAPKPVGFQDVEGRRWMINEFHLERTTTGARDPRLEASFLYDSTDVRGPAFTQLYGQVWNNVGGLNKQGVYFRKFLNDHWKNDEGFRSKNNWRYLRYADVLLMYAEVLNEVGRTADAFQYVDRVRTRAGLANLPRTFNKDQFRDRLKHERVTELSGEGWRWHDLVRWGELTTDAPANVVARDPSFANYKANRDLFLPIPQRDIDINPNLKQNPNF
ncbi:MAG TPA: RagB/SusD family nutrient uptake outer membrane protein [Chitinophagaceae bacterium]|nr:RagB/SusD family nutrient uptake outer membrane protein [Chitinophagaceae bacterium]